MEPEANDAWILALDDEDMVTRSLATLVELETSWSLAAFNRPEDALESMADRDYRVVISDFLMPAMDGIEFLRRAKDVQPFASRVLLTGYADKQNAIRSINEIGLYHYLEKPWDNEALLLVLRNAVERSVLLSKLDAQMRDLGAKDRSMDALRARLLKAIL